MHTYFEQNLYDKPDQWLTEETELVLDHLARIRSEVNARRVLLCNMPAELLHKIFLLVREDCLPDLLYIPHVCCYWRAVALNATFLWSQIDLSFPNIVPLFLERSGTSLLSLRWERPIAEFDDDFLASRLMRSLKPHANRFRYVSMSLGHDEMSYFLRCLDGWRWDMLETLKLRVQASERCLTANFLCDDNPHPNLRSLILFSIIPRKWNNGHIYRNLRVLDLFSSNDRVLPTMSQFLDVLQNCTLLEVLHLTDSGPRPLPDYIVIPPKAGRLINLPCLTLVHLDLHREIDIAYLLAHLIVPGTATMRLTTYSTTSTVCGPLFCLPQDSSQLKCLDFSWGVNFRIPPDRYHLWALSAYSEDHVAGEFPLLLASAFVEGDLAAATRRSLLRLGYLFQDYSAKFLQIEVPLDFLRGVTAEDWNTILSSFSHLTELHVLHVSGGKSLKRAIKAPNAMEDLSACVKPLLHCLTPETPRCRPLVPSLARLSVGRLSLMTAGRLLDDTQRCIRSRMAAATNPLSSLVVEIDGIPRTPDSCHCQ